MDAASRVANEQALEAGHECPARCQSIATFNDTAGKLGLLLLCIARAARCCMVRRRVREREGSRYNLHPIPQQLEHSGAINLRTLQRSNRIKMDENARRH